MANSRIARFIMEVAPPQYVTVMRHRTSKMLDTITEEDQREINNPNNKDTRQYPHSSSSSSPKGSSPSPLSSPLSSSLASSSSVSIPNGNSKYFLKEVHRSLSILNH